MENKEIYHQLYSAKKYPPEYEEYIYSLLNAVINRVIMHINNAKTINKNVDIFVCLQYLVEEHVYNMNLIEKEYADKFMKNDDYNNHLVIVVGDKVFFNEYLEYHTVALISKFNPLISTLNFYLSFIINKYGQLTKPENIAEAIELDTLKKGFLMTKSVLKQLCDGFETEAFSTWRTIHEVECVAKILHDKPYLGESYNLHIKYNNIYRGGEKDKDKVDAFYEEVKVKLKKWDLKSKDFKKFLEYGWLYDIPEWKEKYPELKLNFRKGLEYVAGLSEYSELYEASSEIAHGSPLLIYSNKSYYLNVSIRCLYETFIRMEEMFVKIIAKFNIDSTAYFSMRKIYLAEVKKNLLKLKILTDYSLMSEEELNEEVDFDPDKLKVDL